MRCAEHDGAECDAQSGRCVWFEVSLRAPCSWRRLAYLSGVWRARANRRWHVSCSACVDSVEVSRVGSPPPGPCFCVMSALVSDAPTRRVPRSGANRFAFCFWKFQISFFSSKSRPRLSIIDRVPSACVRCGGRALSPLSRSGAWRPGHRGPAAAVHADAPQGARGRRRNRKSACASVQRLLKRACITANTLAAPRPKRKCCATQTVRLSCPALGWRRGWRSGWRGCARSPAAAAPFAAVS